MKRRSRSDLRVFEPKEYYHWGLVDGFALQKPQSKKEDRRKMALEKREQSLRRHASQYCIPFVSTAQIQNQWEHLLARQRTRLLNALKRSRGEKHSTAIHPSQCNSNREKSKNAAHWVGDGWEPLVCHPDSLQTSNCSLHEEKVA